MNGGICLNDYNFGNLIYELRMRANLTQEELAYKLGVTNKAVSKWENGKAKPTTDMLKKLAVLFNVPIEKLLQIKKNEEKKEITKIVITGGPCAGKTTAMSWIQNHFTDLGYHVIFVHECATELINAGISGITCKDLISFQSALMTLQLQREKIYERAAGAGKVLLRCGAERYGRRWLLQVRWFRGFRLCQSGGALHHAGAGCRTAGKRIPLSPAPSYGKIR